MLKLISSEVPTWLINWTNKVYITDENKYIASISSVVVDWNAIDTYTYKADTIILATAPITSIVITYFYREEIDIEWTWEVTIWDIKTAILDVLRVSQFDWVYKEDIIERRIQKSLKQHFNKISEKSRLQSYAFDYINWLYVTTEWHTVEITTPETYSLDVVWSFIVWNWIYYNYYDYDWAKFTVSWDDLINYNDRIVVWHRVPYWVDKISEVYSDWIKLEYIDEREFTSFDVNFYTIIKDYQGNSYLYLPFSTQNKIAVVKFIPDLAKFSSNLTIVDIPYEYIDVIAYDVARTELLVVEDDRAKDIFTLYQDILWDYKAYKAKTIQRRKNRIWFSWTYKDENHWIEIITDAFYAPYK